jgi:hypothetical protein
MSRFRTRRHDLTRPDIMNCNVGNMMHWRDRIKFWGSLAFNPEPSSSFLVDYDTPSSYSRHPFLLSTPVPGLPQYRCFCLHYRVSLSVVNAQRIASRMTVDGHTIQVVPLFSAFSTDRSVIRMTDDAGEQKLCGDPRPHQHIIA